MKPASAHRRARSVRSSRQGLLHAPLEHRAATCPDSTAVVSGPVRLTFGELDARANDVAHRLVDLGVRPGSRVPIVMEKGWEQVVAALGILKAGAAYVPLDAKLPPQRMLELLERVRSAVAVVQSRTGRLPSELPCVVVGDERAAWSDPPAVACSPDRLAYVMFTSGSTGTPKGVMITHAAASNTLAEVNDRFDVGPEDRVLGLSSLSFDLSVWDVFGVLARGGTLVLPGAHETRDPKAWARLVRDEEVTLWNSVPAFLEMLVDYVGDDAGAIGGSLRIALLSGDWIPLKLPDRLRSLVPAARVVSLGGATEAAIWSICYEIGAVDPSWESIPYGKALAGQMVEVLDDELRPLQVGEAGDLYIGGRGLALGYLDAPELTEAAFVFEERTSRRLYRTGDRGRLLEDGNIQFLGREDAQVKIAGFRVELGEVEAVLQQHPGVRAAAVVAAGRPPRPRRLAAYVAGGGEDLTEADLRTFLADRLPAYMIPGSFAVSAELPVTPNGKVDRARLEELAPERDEYEAPASPLERIVARAWEDVLGVTQVGRNDEFFQLGGDSLLVTRSAVRLAGELGFEPPFQLLFEHSTLAELAAALEQARRDATETVPPSVAVEPARDGERPPLSFGQEQVWFLERLGSPNRAYQFQCSVELKGSLDVALLRQALTEVVRRHEILRTTFVEDDAEPIQIVHPPYEVELPVFDISAAPQEEREQREQEVLRELVGVKFDVGSLPLIRWAVLRRAADDYAIVEVEHHFVHDGWSVGVLWREVGEIYSALLENRQPSLDYPMQFVDFVRSQRAHYRGDERERLLAYWKSRLEGAPELALPGLRPRPKVQTFEGRMSRRVVPQDLYRGLRELSRARSSSLFMTMLVAFLVLLHRYTREEDLVVGSWFGNRHRPGVESLIGMLVNSVLLRERVTGDARFSDLLAAVRETVAGAYAHQEAPFDDVVRSLGRPRDLSRNPVTQVFFSFHDSPIPDIAWPGARGRILERSNGTAKFDLNVVVVPRAEQRRGSAADPDDDLAIMWEHNTDLLEPADVDALAAAYETLLASVVRDPDARIRDLELVPPSTRKRLLVEWNETQTVVPAATAAELFAETARRQPAAVAIESGEETLDYAELDAAARRAATELVRRGASPGDLVGIHLGRSSHLVAAVLGTMLAGAAFVPLDPGYPAARLAFMLEHSGARFVLTTRELAGSRPAGAASAVYVEELAEVQDAPLPSVSPEDVAYVIYTSGSTGRPKGVRVPHRALTNLLLSTAKEPGLDGGDRLLAVTTASFDIAYLELLLPLVVGGTVVLAAPSTVVDGERLAAELDAHRITVMQATPVTWRLLVETGWRGRPELRALVGGEAFPADLAHDLLDRVAEVWNLYGPTETTIWSTLHRVRPDDVEIPIGRPLANTRIYLLDERLAPVPMGAVGELCIGGAGVAAGYHREPELTAERFVADPFGGRTQLYRTGDLCRYRPDGTLEYLGRADRQVKIRGFRIEPAEVERTLGEHPSVRHAVVVPRERDGVPELVAYAVPRGEALDPEELLRLTRVRLPEYMIPSHVVPIAELPLTANGKVDRDRLPEPQPAPATAFEVEAPVDDLEAQLHEIWSKVLNVSELGRHTDFFAAGGHSLIVLRLVSRLRIDLGIDVPVRTIYDYPTLAALAGRIRDVGAHERVEVGVGSSA